MCLIGEEIGINQRGIARLPEESVILALTWRRMLLWPWGGWTSPRSREGPDLSTPSFNQGLDWMREEIGGGKRKSVEKSCKMMVGCLGERRWKISREVSNGGGTRWGRKESEKNCPHPAWTRA
jgi:hypothetical protein